MKIHQNLEHVKLEMDAASINHYYLLAFFASNWALHCGPLNIMRMTVGMHATSNMAKPKKHHPYPILRIRGSMMAAAIAAATFRNKPVNATNRAACIG